MINPDKYKQFLKEPPSPSREAVARGMADVPPPRPQNPLEGLKTGFSNFPQDEGRMVPEGMHMVGAAIGAGATTESGLPGAAMAGAGLGAAGMEGLRQLIGQGLGVYTNDPSTQLAEQGAAGLGYAAAEGAGGLVRGAVKLGDAFVRGAGERFLLPRGSQFSGSTIPPFRVDRLVERPGEVLSPASRNQYTPGAIANDLRGQINKGFEEASTIWHDAKDALTKKYGDTPVVDVKGLRDEMMKKVKDFSYDPNKKMDRTSYQYLMDLIDDTTSGVAAGGGKGKLTVQEALDNIKRINREVTFSRSRPVDARVNVDDTLLNTFKEAIYKRVDGLAKEFKVMREGYSGLKQLERDAAPLLNQKDLPAAFESAENRGNLDFQTVQELSNRFPQINHTLARLRDSIAGQSFDRPWSNLFGNLYGYGHNWSARAAEAIPVSVVGPAIGGGAEELVRQRQQTDRNRQMRKL